MMPEPGNLPHIRVQARDRRITRNWSYQKVNSSVDRLLLVPFSVKEGAFIIALIIHLKRRKTNEEKVIVIDSRTLNDNDVCICDRMQQAGSGA